MQNIEQILQELGIEIPEDKKNDLKAKMSENYRAKSDYDNVVRKRDEYKTSLDGVQAKLDGFKDVDVDDLKGQIATLTTQLNNEKKARADDARKIEVEKTVNDFLSSTDDKGNKMYEFLNDITEDHYRNALVEELGKDSARGKSIGDIFKTMTTGEDGTQKTGIFVDRQQERAKQNAARFTKPASNPNNAPKYTMSELMKMKNENPDLDIKQYM